MLRLVNLANKRDKTWCYKDGTDEKDSYYAINDH